MKVTQWIPMALGLIKLSNCQIEPFIVGGSFTAIKRYPHSAFLSITCGRKTGSYHSWICGASIINQRLLLTAAHCLATCREYSEIIASVGSEHKDRGANISAYSYIIHESYDPLTSTADIGLVRLYIRLKFNGLIQRVALMRYPPYNEPAYVAGWGLTDEIKPKHSPFLKHVDQKVLSNQLCMRVLNSMPSGTICATAQKASDYAASGDSGSALVVRGYIQLGLVSYKIPARALNIIVYTDVGHYYEWIVANVQRLFCV